MIRSRWENTTGLTVAALGYGLPYLDRFRGRAHQCVALMPSQQGAVVWPEREGCASALVWADMLPLPDASIDRLLVAHALEAVERPETLLEEAWRVTAPEGRVIVVVPSRRGIWARADRTPFGQGSPYSRTQLRELFNQAILSPIFWGEALYFPPIAKNFLVRSAPAIERVGAALRLPFAGVHVVEAIKQVHRPVETRAVSRSRLPRLRPALPPQTVPPCGFGEAQREIETAMRVASPATNGSVTELAPRGSILIDGTLTIERSALQTTDGRAGLWPLSAPTMQPTG